MAGPTILVRIKPEEGVRNPEVVSDSKLLGLTNVIDRFQTGELDSTDLADTLDTYASILRQIIAGEDPTASYLTYPPTNLKQILVELTELADNVNTITMTATEAVAQFDFVKVSADDSMALAQADISANAQTVGCLIDTAKSIGEEGKVATSGKRVNGILTGATFGQKFYLDTTTPGKITSVVTSTNVLLRVGRALNATDLLVDVGEPKIRSIP